MSGNFPASYPSHWDGPRLGLFLHWGLYSLTGWQEQVQGRLGIPREEYEQLARRFCPLQFGFSQKKIIFFLFLSQIRW